MRANPADGTLEPSWRRRGRAALLAMERPWVAGAVALGVYLAFAWAHCFGHGQGKWLSPFPYFNDLADAFLHGQTYLRQAPSTHDLTAVDGRLYLYWGPVPALVLLPFVALFGPGFSDVLFTAALGGLDVLLVALLLRAAVVARVVRLDRLRRGVLVACFAFGTVHLTLAPYGRVWFTSQLVGFCAVTLAYLAALRLRGAPAALVSGLCLAAATATKNNLLFTGLWPAWFLLSRSPATARLGTWPRRAGLLAIGLLPVFAALGLLLLYNQVRFGSPLENGYRFHAMGEGFRADFEQYGLFHLHYLPRNVFYELLTYPLPLRDASVDGGGLFWMTPPFLAAFWGLSSRPRAQMVALVLSIVLTAVPIFLLMGTGYVQWGPRYTLDFTTPLLLLTALGLHRWSRRWTVIALVPAILVYLVGVVHFAIML